MSEITLNSRDFSDRVHQAIVELQTKDISTETLQRKTSEFKKIHAELLQRTNRDMLVNFHIQEKQIDLSALPHITRGITKKLEIRKLISPVCHYSDIVKRQENNKLIPELLEGAQR